MAKTPSPPRCARTWPNACPTTCCRPRTCGCRRCHDPGGKLERRALPAPAGDAFARGDYAPPQGELETLLAQWWQELLAAERIGRDDDFFELGGHSLLAMRLLARLREELDVAVAPSLLFRRPRLAGFAEAVLAAALQDAAAPEQE
ncbi:hypothetical protein FE772_14795 [Lysobacter enzymogenes]|nr:phosphopantetheine-binding protein [Lysobacter enzymogenes]QCW26725.1 hypothetical protein FE772_14795 [Lysobacter enzymogenes]